MRCRACNAEAAAGDRFCGACGARLVAPVEEAVGEIRRFEGHPGPVVRVAFSPDGRRALSASDDATIYVWDVESGRELNRRLGAGSFSAVDFSSDGRRALSSDFGRILRLWDLESGRELRHFEAQGYIDCVAFSPDGRRALIGTDGPSIRLLDLESGRELRRFEGHKNGPTSVAFSSDGRRAVSGSFEPDYSDEAVHLWDLESGRELRRPERLMMLVASVAFSPDGGRALAGTYESTAYLWDVESGREQCRYQGHTGNVFCVAFSPDGGRILTSSGTDAFVDHPLLKDLEVDNTVRLWDTDGMQEIVRFAGHGGNVNAVAFSPDGRRALSGSSDKSVRLWSLPAASQPRRTSLSSQ